MEAADFINKVSDSRRIDCDLYSCARFVDDSKEASEPPRFKWGRRSQAPSLVKRLPVERPGGEEVAGTLHPAQGGQLRPEEHQRGVERR